MATKLIIFTLSIYLASSDDVSGDVYLQGPTKVRVFPSSSSATESIRFAPDPRNQNNIITDDEGVDRWRIVSKIGNQLIDWPLTLTLDASTYGFEPNKADSAVAITMRGFCELTSECDSLFSISVGDKYFSFATDFDGFIWTGSQQGIQIYPGCGGQLATGDPAGFLSSVTKDEPNAMWYALRRVLSGGDYNNWERLRAWNTHNGENFPITFELINNAVDDTFTVRFGSDTFKKGNQLECVFQGAAPTDAPIKLFMTNDWPDNADEIIVIRSFVINGNKFRRENDDELEGEEFIMEQIDVVNGNERYSNIIGACGLSLVIMIIGLILNKYCFGSCHEQAMKLGQETRPLLINVQ